jgi:ribosomal protein S17
MISGAALYKAAHVEQNRYRGGESVLIFKFKPLFSTKTVHFLS